MFCILKGADKLFNNVCIFDHRTGCISPGFFQSLGGTSTLVQWFLREVARGLSLVSKLLHITSGMMGDEVQSLGNCTQKPPITSKSGLHLPLAPLPDLWITGTIDRCEKSKFGKVAISNKSCYNPIKAITKTPKLGSCSTSLKLSSKHKYFQLIQSLPH